MSATENPFRLITPIARLSYPALFKPAKAMDEKGTPKFQCELIFEPGTDLSELKAAANEAAKAKWGTKIPKNWRSPLRGGNVDRAEKDGYEGRIFMSARSTDRPGIVMGPNREPVMNESDVYGGCYVVASVTAFAYDKGGNKGVAFALNNVWKVRDGESFGTSRKSAEDEFAGLDIDADSFGSDESLV